jgi:hypothetical protein
MHPSMTNNTASRTPTRRKRRKLYVQLQNQLWWNPLQEIGYWNLLFGREILVVGFEGHVFEQFFHYYAAVDGWVDQLKLA